MIPRVVRAVASPRSARTAAEQGPDAPQAAQPAVKFPNTRSVQAAYRADAPELRVDGGTANPETLGAAYDFAMRFALDPLCDASVARSAFLGNPAMVAEIDAVVLAAQVAAGLGDHGTVDRASRALALLTEGCRVGLMPGSPIGDLLEARSFTAQALLTLAPEDALRQLDELRAVPREALVPRLSGPYLLGPTFDASALCKADADVIAGSLLLDFKTSIGSKSARTGAGADPLDLIDMYQVVAYALFDRSDRYKIRQVGIYSARFGHLVTWGLQLIPDELAGESVTIQESRELVWHAPGGR